MMQALKKSVPLGVRVDASDPRHCAPSSRTLHSSVPGSSILGGVLFSSFCSVILRTGRQAVAAGSIVLSALPLLLVLSATTTHAAGLMPLNATQMADVTAQSGIMLSLESLNNVDSTNTPYSNCSNPSLATCRLALQFDGQADQWLVLKEYYGTLQLNKVELTNGVLPNVATSYANPERFENADGSTCALGGTWPNCTTVAGQTVVQIVYPNTDNRAPGVYQDMTTFLNIGQEAIEADVGGVKGYNLNNASGSMQAIRISDSLGPNHSAGMRYDGQAYLFGF